MRNNYIKRLEQLFLLVEKANIKYYLETKQVNIFYLTGYKDAPFPMLISNKKIFIFLPTMLIQEFQKLSPVADNVEIIETTRFNLEHVREILKKNRIKNIGINYSDASYATYLYLSKVVNLKDIPDLVGLLRQTKDEIEIRNVSSACKITTQIYNNLSNIITKNDSELSGLAKVKIEMIKQNLDFAFEPIVAFGKNAAYPHHIPSKKIKLANKIMLVDFGCKINGYCADLTRVLFLDKIFRLQKLVDIYKIVDETRANIIEIIKPGMIANDVHNMAVKMFAKHGLDKYFIHGLGHGVGLEIHEYPRISASSNDMLEENMIVTVEPGLYIEGLGGIRIEDTVLLTKKGAKILTKI